MQVCNKIVETERGVATTYKGNYTQYMQQKDDSIAKQWTMFEKWNKEVQKQKDIIRRCCPSPALSCMPHVYASGKPASRHNPSAGRSISDVRRCQWQTQLVGFGSGAHWSVGVQAGGWRAVWPCCLG